MMVIESSSGTIVNKKAFHIKTNHLVSLNSLKSIKFFHKMSRILDV